MTLALLRSSPVDACSVNVYRTGPNPGSFAGHANIVEGGRCTIACTQAAPGVYDLKATAAAHASNDYFYPWLQRGIGWVQVPKACPDGSIVMTGGVNGCTLVVTEFLNNYFFYHDGDSKYLYPGLTTGREVARVRPKDYDPLGWGSKMFQQALADSARRGIMPVGDVSYAHFVVAVKKNGRYGMYATGIMSLNGLKKLPFAVTPCIVTFG